MNEAARIGILGGTLDPIHVGHIDAALAARDALGLDRVLIVPAHVPPHRSEPSTSPFHRFAMAAIAVTGVEGLAVSDLELLAPGPSYTADTLARLRESLELDASQIFFITGADAFAEIETWKRYPAVLELANFVVVSRPGMPLQALRQRLPALKDRMRLPRRTAPPPAQEGAHAHETWIFLVDAPTAEVSSTEIRRRIAERRPLSGLVPPGVEQHITQHALYAQRPRTHSRQITCMAKTEQKRTGRNHVAGTPRRRSKKLPADVARAVRAALDKKAQDVVVLDLRNTPAFTDFFVLCSGLNTRQVKAIADAVDETLRGLKLRPAHTEGYERAEWVLMDYFNFIVHVFTPQTRAFYALERLWGDAEKIEVSDEPTTTRSA